jgi:hypothetical protein
MTEDVQITALLRGFLLGFGFSPSTTVQGNPRLESGKKSGNLKRKHFFRTELRGMQCFAYLVQISLHYSKQNSIDTTTQPSD